MAMNKQRRTSNLNNVVTYDTSGNVVLPASVAQGLAINSLLKADATGKVVAAVAGTDYLSTNIYNADGTLTGNRTLTSGGYNLTFTGSNTAASAIARGLYLTPTLVAAANSDVLVGLDISPTFTLGAFTGVSSLGLRVTGDIFQNTGNFVGNTTHTYSNSFSGTTTGNITVGNQANITHLGGANTNYFNTFASSLGTNTGASGNFTLTLTAYQAANYVRSLTSTAVFSSRGFLHTTNRTDPSDIGTSSANAYFGMYNIFTHSNTAGAGIVTANIHSTRNDITNNNGTMTNVYAVYNVATLGTQNTSLATSTTNFYGFKNDLSIGSATGGAAALTNFYGIYLTTPTLGATGTITNRWGLYAPDSAMNHHINGTVSIGTATIAGYKLDVAGTGRFQDNLLVSKNQAAETSITVSNTTTGTTSRAGFIATSVNGSMLMGKVSSTYTTVGTIVQVNDAIITNSTNGDISIFNSVGTGRIKFASNAATIPQVVLSETGSLLVGTTTDTASALLKVSSTTKGFLPPVMTTTEKNAISSPATGLVVFDSTLGKLCVYVTSAWQTVTSA